MAILWPHDLPQQPLLSGWQMTMGMSVQESDTDKGPPKRRSRTDFVPHPITLRMSMTREQWISFMAYFKNDLYNGALSSMIYDPITQLYRTFTFKSGPSAVPDDDPNVFIVTMNIQRMD